MFFQWLSRAVEGCESFFVSGITVYIFTAERCDEECSGEKRRLWVFCNMMMDFMHITYKWAWRKEENSFQWKMEWDVQISKKKKKWTRILGASDDDDDRMGFLFYWATIYMLSVAYLALVCSKIRGEIKVHSCVKVWSTPRKLYSQSNSQYVHVYNCFNIW